MTQLFSYRKRNINDAKATHRFSKTNHTTEASRAAHPNFRIHNPHSPTDQTRQHTTTPSPHDTEARHRDGIAGQSAATNTQPQTRITPTRPTHLNSLRLTSSPSRTASDRQITATSRRKNSPRDAPSCRNRTISALPPRTVSTRAGQPPPSEIYWPSPHLAATATCLRVPQLLPCPKPLAALAKDSAPTPPALRVDLAQPETAHPALRQAPVSAPPSQLRLPVRLSMTASLQTPLTPKSQKSAAISLTEIATGHIIDPANISKSSGPTSHDGTFRQFT